jgi:hypothetical protein
MKAPRSCIKSVGATDRFVKPYAPPLATKANGVFLLLKPVEIEALDALDHQEHLVRYRLGR